MNNTDTETLFGALDSITAKQTQRAMLKRQTEQDQIRKEVLHRGLQLREEVAGETAHQNRMKFVRDEIEKTRASTDAMTGKLAELRKQNAAAAWERDPSNPGYQLKMAQAEEKRARANSLGKIPKLEELAGIRNLRQETEDALIAAEQSGDPIAVRKAQRDVDMAERTFNHFLKAKDDTGHVEEELDASGRLISRVVKRPFDPNKDGQGVARQPQPPGGAANKAAKRVTIKTREEFDALPSGTPFIVNGQAGTKN